MGREPGSARGRVRGVVVCAGVVCALIAWRAAAYEPVAHQQLTFLAAQYLNRCIDGSPVPRLEPLDVRYVARASMTVVESGWFGWFHRADYYDRATQSDRNFLWLFDARVHDRYDEALASLASAGDIAERYGALGRVAGTLQIATSPAHVVPVNIARWWRFSVSDRFDAYPVDDEALEASLQAECAALLDAPEISLQQLLVDTANDTLAAVQAPIPGWPASWQAFWSLASDPEDFGEYGRAGNNFGKRVSFDCYKVRCKFAEDDPLYREFAHARHRTAVMATARAMLWEQRRVARAAEVEASSASEGADASDGEAEVTGEAADDVGGP